MGRGHHMEMVTLQIQTALRLMFTSPRSSSSAVCLSSSTPPPQVKTKKEEPKECWQKGDFELFAWRQCAIWAPLRERRTCPKCLFLPFYGTLRQEVLSFFSIHLKAMWWSYHPFTLVETVLTSQTDEQQLSFSFFFCTWSSHLVFLSWLSPHAACVSWWVNNMHM